MARSEARLMVSIWEDPDFLALSPGAQRMFMFLISQPDLAHDGVIPLRERRWSKKAGGLSVEAVRGDLDELSTARFVLIDDDTEELLVRSFIRRDKVYRQPNVLRAAGDHLETVSSGPIRSVVAVELGRIQANAEDIPEGSKDVLDAMLKAVGIPSLNPTENPSGKGSGLRPGERGVVTAVSSDSPNPVPRAPTPRPQPSAGGRAGARDEPGGAATDPPPEQCPKHLNDPDPPSCGPCADARKRRARWDREQLAADQAARSAEAHQRAETLRLAIAACDLCTPDGRLTGGRLCTHDPHQPDRLNRGLAAARAAARKEAP